MPLSFALLYLVGAIWLASLAPGGLQLRASVGTALYISVLLGWLVVQIYLSMALPVGYSLAIAFGLISHYVCVPLTLAIVELKTSAHTPWTEILIEVCGVLMMHTILVCKKLTYFQQTPRPI